MPAAGDALIGKIIDNRYEVLEPVGQGHTGSIYKARHLMMNRFVALKLLHASAGDEDNPNSRLIERFKQEAKLIASLHHPNIVSVLDFGFTTEGRAFLVMDFLDGMPLSTAIQNEGRLAPDRSLTIAAQVCDALAHAHSLGIIHRDIKPSNIVLLPNEFGDEQVKLVDFSIAKLLSSDGKVSQKLTQTGEQFASPAYMSPEQCLGRELDCRSDLYSFGCVLYEMLTGTAPFTGDTPTAVANSHLTRKPPPFHETSPPLTHVANLEAIVFKAMSLKPEDRHQSAQDLRTALLASQNQPIKTQNKLPAFPSRLAITAVSIASLALLFFACKPWLMQDNSIQLLLLKAKYQLENVTLSGDDPRRLKTGMHLFEELRKSNQGKEACNLFRDLPVTSLPAYYGGDQVKLAATYEEVVTLLAQQGQPDAAKALAKKTYAILKNLLEKPVQNLDEAEKCKLLKWKVTVSEIGFGSESRESTWDKLDYIDCLRLAGKLNEAIALGDIVRVRIHERSDMLLENAHCEVNLSSAYVGLKQFDKAEDLLARARAAYASDNKEDAYRMTTQSLALVFEQDKKTERAEEILQELTSQEADELAHNDLEAAYDYYQAGALEFRLQHYEKAESYLKKCLRACEAHGTSKEAAACGAVKLLAQYYKSANLPTKLKHLLADSFNRQSLEQYPQVFTADPRDAEFVRKLLADSH